MNKATAIEKVVKTGLIPIVRASSSGEALKVMDAICAGGVATVEVTMTVPGALKVLEQMADKLGDRVLLGAGTILDPETARAAILAGAQFLVSPNLDVKVIEVARRYSCISVPAGLTPTEIVTAWEAGADFVKVFPCNAMGGASYIRSIRGPLPQIEVIPTGGVNLETIGEFLKAGAAAVGVGTEMVNRKAVQEGRFDVITENARKFVEAVARARAGEKKD
jgi:2-dehydro-3-deoxyphosphogluconate aldolase/(4S)-4-hydroxy-2-oxoglutarate aldolase